MPRPFFLPLFTVVPRRVFSEVQCSNPRSHSPGLGRMRPPPRSAPPLLTATIPRGPQTWPLGLFVACVTIRGTYPHRERLAGGRTILPV